MIERVLLVDDEPNVLDGLRRHLRKRIEVDTIQLRGYLSWMRKVGKVSSTGRARATWTGWRRPPRRVPPTPLTPPLQCRRSKCSATRPPNQHYT